MNIKKKVGIITFHESPNYGAILQAFALQRFLRDEDYDAEIIDYCNPGRSHSQVSGIKKFRSKIWKLTFWKLFRSKKREHNTEKFKDKYMVFSNLKYTNSNMIANSPPNYDYYITGSDQVWNPRNNAYDPTYFLSFAPDEKKKISYAPSFGLKKLPESYKFFCKPLVERLNEVSIREKSGAELIKEICGLTTRVVVDPTFLLDMEIWDKIAGPVNPKREGYIFCYYMPGDKKVEKAIKNISMKISIETGLKIVNAGKKVYGRIKWWENTRYDAGPDEFIRLIRDADCVITNSFHGTAFSIIFNKNFLVPVNLDLPKEDALNSRIIDLLDLLGLQNRLCDTEAAVEFCDKHPIDYGNVNNLLVKEVQKSKKYLLQVLEN